MKDINPEQLKKLFEMVEKLSQKPQTQSEFGSIIVYAIGALIIAGLAYAVFLKIWEGIKVKKENGNGTTKSDLLSQKIDNIDTKIDELKVDLSEHKKEDNDNFDKISDKIDLINGNMSKGFSEMQRIVISALSKAQ